MKYDVTFPMLQKIEVNGERRHSLYQYAIDNNHDNKKGIKAELHQVSIRSLLLDQKTKKVAKDIQKHL